MIHTYDLLGRAIFDPRGMISRNYVELRIALKIFSSPEPLGSQGELIGWP